MWLRSILLSLLLISCSDDMSLLSKKKKLVLHISPEFRTASFNTYLGLAVGSSAKNTAIKKHIDRVNADFLTLTETNDADVAYVTSNYPNYPYVERLSTGTLQVMFLSKYEILNSEEINISGRKPLYCEVEINGKKIGIVSHHNASWCITGCNTSPTQLPTEPMAHDRCVQLYATLNFLKAKKINDTTLKGFIIQGDWNDDVTHPQVATYTDANKPSGAMTLPVGVSYPINNAQFPAEPLADANGYNGNMHLNLSTDLNGDTYTIWANNPNAEFTFPMRADYIAYSDQIQLIGGEILNSEVDANTGLSKVGNPLSFDDSRTASDHKLVFADFIIN